MHMFVENDDKIVEPVNLQGLKQYLSLREDDITEDPYLNQLITTARSRLEEEGGLERVIALRSFTAEFDGGYWHQLHRSLVDIDSVTYTDTEGVEQEIKDYEVQLGNAALIGFNIPADIDGSVTVKFISGYEQVPTSLILAIKMMCKEMYSRSITDPLTDEVRKLIQSEVIYDL